MELQSICSHLLKRRWWSSLVTPALIIGGLALTSVNASATCAVPNLLTNGQPTDASQVMANFNALAACLTPVQTPPQGRLTLISNTPVMNADATAQSTIYYTPYQGNQAPVAAIMYSFSQLSYSLSTSAHLSGNLYDIFAYNAAGSIALCTGPAWSSVSARSAAVTMVNGLWTNQNILTCTVSGGGSTTSVPANNATYLGTFYATANGQTGMAFNPTPASGGTNNFLGLYNAYNRVRIKAQSSDSSTGWTYNSATWRATDNSNSNRISFVDGLGTENIETFAAAYGYAGNNLGRLSVGVNRDSTSATPTNLGRLGTGGAGNNDGGQYVAQNFMPSIGFHYVQAMESAYSANTVNFLGSSPTQQVQYLIISLGL